MNRRHGAVLGAVLLSVIATAGIGYSATRGEAGQPEPPDASSWPARVAMSSPYPRPEAISEFQWAIVQDGWVEDGEMQKAVAATVACANERGVPIKASAPGTGGRVDGTLTLVTSEPVEPAAVQACKMDFMDAAAMLYATQFDARPMVAPEEYDRLLNECLRGQGLVAEGPMSTERFAALSATSSGTAAFKQCGETADAVPLLPLAEEQGHYVVIEGCLAGLGYLIPPLADRTEPFWTPGRINGIRSLPDLLPVWRKCQLVGQVAELAETR